MVERLGEIGWAARRRAAVLKYTREDAERHTARTSNNFQADIARVRRLTSKKSLDDIIGKIDGLVPRDVQTPRRGRRPR